MWCEEDSRREWPYRIYGGRLPSNRKESGLAPFVVAEKQVWSLWTGLNRIRLQIPKSSNHTRKQRMPVCREECQVAACNIGVTGWRGQFLQNYSLTSCSLLNQLWDDDDDDDIAFLYWLASIIEFHLVPKIYPIQALSSPRFALLQCLGCLPTVPGSTALPFCGARQFFFSILSTFPFKVLTREAASTCAAPDGGNLT